MLRALSRSGWLVAALLLSLPLVDVHATGGDPALQGRLLPSSDGAFFIYKDGAKYAVQPVQLSDDAIDAIPDGVPAGLDQLFSSSPPAASAPGAAAAPPTADVSPLPQVQSVPLGNGINLGVPQGYSVTTSAQGQATLDKNSVSQITAKLEPAQPNTGAILTPAQQEFLSTTGITVVWGAVVELPAQGKATQITQVRFTGSRLSGGAFQNYQGSLFALARKDAGVVVLYITRGAEDESAAVVTALVSLTQ